MPHVPSSLNFFSADGNYGFLPFSGPAGIRAAYEQHILPKLAPNQSAWVVPGKISLESGQRFQRSQRQGLRAGTYECDGPKMEAPSGSYWACQPGNASYDAHIAGKVAEFAAWAAAEAVRQEGERKREKKVHSERTGETSLSDDSSGWVARGF